MYTLCRPSQILERRFEEFHNTCFAPELIYTEIRLLSQSQLQYYCGMPYGRFSCNQHETIVCHELPQGCSNSLQHKLPCGISQEANYPQSMIYFISEKRRPVESTELYLFIFCWHHQYIPHTHTRQIQQRKFTSLMHLKFLSKNPFPRRQSLIF